MKVLLTHEQFAPDFAGGGEYVALETARYLVSHGANVKVVTTGDPAITSYEGITTTRLRRHRYLFNLAARKIAEHARHADIIQTFNYHACLPSLRAGRMLGKPVVCTILGLFGNEWRTMRGPVAGRMWQAWERWLLRQPFDRTIFLSDFSIERGIKMGADPERAQLINPGISLENYSSDTPKEDVVLFAGKLDGRKGIRETLKVAQALPEVRFRVFGWGPYESYWRRMASKNVEFVHFERGQPLHDQFAKARIFVFPSHVETFGLAVVEAMASGCAVVSTSTIPFAGITIPVEDTAEYTQAIHRLWHDRDLSAKFGQENAKLAKRYTWDRSIEKLLRVYRELLDEKTTSANNAPTPMTEGQP